MTPHFRQVVIYGVGELGGSLGLALRRRALAASVVGLGRSETRLAEAQRLGAIDRFTTDPSQALSGADALVFCVPPILIREKIAEFAPLTEPGAFVTDVGSVKAAIAAEAARCFGQERSFVGSHPMTGSEKSGIHSARHDLFEGACCIVTPDESTPAGAVAVAVGLWRALGSRIALMTPERHDRLLSSLSHLPHLVAASLIETLFLGGDATHLFRSLAGKGLLDTTRIAGAEPALWGEIFSENRDALASDLDRLIEVLASWRRQISRPGFESEIAQRLELAMAHRRDLTPNTDDASS